MLAALVAEAVRDLRRILHVRLVGIDLAVEDAQRAALKAVLAVFAEVVELVAEVVLQDLAVDRPTLRAADGVEAELQVLESERLQEVDGQHDDLSIGHRVLLAERLDTELMEFAHAAGLRAVVAEHRADVEELDERSVAVELVLQVRAHDGCRVLRAQRDAASAAVFERVHLLVDDIRAFADAAVEELRVLEERRADLFESIAAADLADLPFDVIPFADSVGQNVFCSPRGIGEHESFPLYVLIWLLVAYLMTAARTPRRAAGGASRCRCRCRAGTSRGPSR